MDKRSLKLFVAAMSGHALEIYDFTICAVFAVIIGKLYFPNLSEASQLLAILSIYASGFFMRPVGGIIFGKIENLYCSKVALTLSATIMAFVALSIALLPSYSKIGIIAPVAFILLRFIQGLCIGINGAGSSIFVLETATSLRPGIVSGIVNSFLTAGILLAFVSGMIINHFFSFNANAWRYAFVASSVMVCITLYLRLKAFEMPIFKQLEQSRKISGQSIKKIFSQNLESCIITITAGAMVGAIIYVAMVYIYIFLTTYTGYSKSIALYIAVYTNICIIILSPVFGSMADKIGYSKQMEISAISTIALSMPLYMMLVSGSLRCVILAATIFAALAAAIYSPLYPYVVSLFTPEQRYGGIACSVNIGMALFGGTCIVISLHLTNTLGITCAPTLYISAICFLFIAINKTLRNRKLDIETTIV